MQFLKIKQAELALAKGRLDEACEVLSDAGLRAHRSGQALVDRVIAALMDRGRKHLAAGRFGEALQDCLQAEQFGGRQAELADFRQQIEQTALRQRHAMARQADAMAAARNHAEAGRISVAEKLLAAAGDDERAGMIQQDLQQRRLAAEAALDAAETAMRRQDWAAASDALAQAETAHAGHERLADLAPRAAEAVVRLVGEHFEAGRVDRAEALLSQVGWLTGRSDDLADLAGAVGQCCRAWRWIRRGEFRRAGQALRLVGGVAGQPRWLRDAIERCERAAGEAEAVQAGPLGLLSDAQCESSVGRELAGEPPRSKDVPPGPRPSSGSALPPRFVLQVDGAGSFVVARGREVTIGPISSSRRPDVGLMADATVPVVSLTRSEGDYVLRCEKTVTINDRPMSQKVLADGDTIDLSPRCRLRFRLPNAASATAQIEVASGRLGVAGARCILLADREIVLGPGRTSHVRTPHLAAGAVLVLRDGRMTCRSDEPVKIGQKPAGPADPVAVGTPVTVGPVGFVVTDL